MFVVETKKTGEGRVSFALVLFLFVIYGTNAFGQTAPVPVPLPLGEPGKEKSGHPLPIPLKSAKYDPFAGAMEVKRFSFELNDDRDFDGQPDDWVRRKSAGFPRYVKMEIDRTNHFKGKQSLRFDVNGGRGIYYSPVIRIDAKHSYVFQGKIRTEGLKNDAALLSLSFLNHKRERIQRFLSAPISGTHAKWQTVQMGPIMPRNDVRFAVIGCHVVQSDQMDIEGKVWFDEVWIGSLPRFDIESNFETHFREANVPIPIHSRVTGLDDSRSYRLHLEMSNLKGKAVLSKTFLLKAKKEGGSENPIAWVLPSQVPGFYRVRSRLQRDDEIIIDKQTSFVVLDRMNSSENKGEFGWSMPAGRNGIPVDDVLQIAKESGINWLKYPLWRETYQKSSGQNDDGMLLSRLYSNGIMPVGLLNHPPDKIRMKFAKKWNGVSEIFTMPPDFWRTSIDGVMARYSSSVRMWQLGEEEDKSFIGLNKLPETMTTLKKEFDRIGRDTMIGVHWDWTTPIPLKKHVSKSFLSLSTNHSLDEEGIRKALRASLKSGYQRWLLIKPISKSSSVPLSERASDLIRRLVAAKSEGAEGIYAYDVFDTQHGLLNADGSPTELFLPWRMTAFSLKNSKFIGSIQMPKESTNYVFSRNGVATIVLWNRKSVVEKIFLGSDVIVQDMWGSRIPVEIGENGKQQIPVNQYPVFVSRCSDKIARWRMEVKFEKGVLPSSTDYHAEAILGVNSFSSGVGGTVSFHTPRDWDVDPKQFEIGLSKGEKMRLPTYIKLPPGTSLGKQKVRIDFVVDDEQRYHFSVYRNYQVGVGDVMIKVKVLPGKKPNTLIVEQMIINNTKPAELLDFRCSLEVPSRRRQDKYVTKLGSGQEAKRTYLIENADQLKTRKFKLKAEQTDGRRVLNYIWTDKKSSF